MTLHKSLTFNKISRAIIREDMPGFCITCGKKYALVEPDAERVPCRTRACQCSPTVYGAERLLEELGGG